MSITRRVAMGVPAVAAAVELIAQQTGTLPVKIYERDGKGGKVTAPEHPAFALVHDMANPWTSASKLRSQVTADALLNDRGGFALAIRVNGHVQELHRLIPDSVTVEYDEITNEPSYVVATDAGQVRHHFTDIIHIEPFENLAPITRAREAIALALVQEKKAAGLFSKGGLTGHIQFPSSLAPEDLDKVRDHFVRETERNGVGVVDMGGSYTPHNFSATDSQFLDHRYFEIEEIGRAFGVSPTFLNDLRRATFQNAEQMSKQLHRPWS